MSSIQGKLLNFMLRHRKKKEVFDINTSIPKFRNDCEKAAALFAKLPEGVIVSPFTINEIPAEWIGTADTRKDKVILYTHGGGYVSGSCADHRAIVAKNFVKGAGAASLLFEYRLAPEHPYPAAVDDSLAVYRWLLDQGVLPSNIILAGESAGGGLCLALLLAIRDSEIPLPAAAVAIQPWTDLTCGSESYGTKHKVSLAPINSWTVFSKYYVGENNPRHPWISPLYGDLSGLPPLFIAAGTDDELFDEAVRFANKAKAAGVEVTIRVGEGMVHCYPLLPPFVPEARRTLGEICGFIKNHLKINDAS